MGSDIVMQVDMMLDYVAKYLSSIHVWSGKYVVFITHSIRLSDRDAKLGYMTDKL